MDEHKIIDPALVSNLVKNLNDIGETSLANIVKELTSIQEPMQICGERHSTDDWCVKCYQMFYDNETLRNGNKTTKFEFME